MLRLCGEMDPAWGKTGQEQCMKLVQNFLGVGVPIGSTLQFTEARETCLIA